MRVGGIDVSHKTVMVAIRKNEKTAKPCQFDNGTEGHLRLIKALRSAQVTRVCLEATGTYHLDLAVALCDAGLEVMVPQNRNSPVDAGAALLEGLEHDGSP